jgi:hypothetical protein
MHVHTHIILVANLDAITHLCLSDRIRQMDINDGAGRKEEWYPQPETVFCLIQYNGLRAILVQAKWSLELGDRKGTSGGCGVHLPAHLA